MSMACEMCGKDTNLVTATIDSAELRVCEPCAKYGIVKAQSRIEVYERRRTVKIEQPEIKLIPSFASILKSARDGRKLNQQEFAQLLQERESVVQKWESGTLKPNLETAQRLSK